jgi:hypothetical protein
MRGELERGLFIEKEIMLNLTPLGCNPLFRRKNCKQGVVTPCYTYFLTVPPKGLSIIYKES